MYFSLCFTRCKIQKVHSSKDKIRGKQKNKSKRKRKTNSARLCSKCTGGVKCAHADRVTSDIYISGTLLVSLNAKGNMVFHQIKPFFSEF